MIVFIEEYFGRRGKNEDHCIFVGHGVLREYEINIF
jgi:hypothetical protein